MTHSPSEINELYALAWAEMRRATVDKKHPFRYFVLGTQYQNKAYQRTIALRSIDKENVIWAYTDLRTPKVTHLQAIPQASLLFFYPKKWLQVRIDAHTTIKSKDTNTLAIWKSISEQAKKDYTTKLVPGSPISSPEEVTYLDNEENYFCRISFEPKSIEVLQIKREGHLRVLYQIENSTWKGVRLTP